MENEFFDLTRQEILRDFASESLHMIKQRLAVYMENQDLFTIYQKTNKKDGRQFVENELRCCRLIEVYCDLYERAE